MTHHLKVGILTFHSAHNYGAILQAYALLVYLQSEGYDATIIDYRSPLIEKSYHLYDSEFFAKLSLKKKIRWVLTLPHRWVRRFIFNRWIHRHMDLSPVEGVPYDVVVYGSDQIWKIADDDRTFLGENKVLSGKNIAYSASAGNVENIKGIDLEYLRKALGRFSSLSVREEALQHYIQPLTPTPVHCTLDPVFLLEADAWSHVAGKSSIRYKYILVYNLLADDNIKRMARELQARTGYRIINIQIDIGVRELVSPSDVIWVSPSRFIRLIRDAEYVLTSSFHGTVFSLIFNKIVFAYLPERTSERVLFLLEKFGLRDQFLEQLPPELPENLDYSYANSRLKELREESRLYLLSNI